MNVAAARIIAELGLAPLPYEGGFFRRQWVSDQRASGGRPVASLIWFLITGEGFSALHRVDADERWDFHQGDAIEHVRLEAANGTARVTGLGGDAPGARRRSVVVPAGIWQGARLAARRPEPRGWALLSCTMTPAWEERGFVLGERGSLRREFPAAARWVRALTR